MTQTLPAKIEIRYSHKFDNFLLVYVYADGVAEETLPGRYETKFDAETARQKLNRPQF